MVSVPVVLKTNKGVEEKNLDTCFIIGSNGTFIKKTFDMFDSCTKVNGIDFLEEVEEFVNLKTGKIPDNLLYLSLVFLSKIYRENKTEACILIYYNFEKKKFFVDSPLQIGISPVSVKYLKEFSEFNGYQVVGTIHSHPSFTASHSGGDDHDEKFFDGIHVTIGDIDKFPEVPEFSISSSIVINGKRFKKEPGEIFLNLEKKKHEEKNEKKEKENYSEIPGYIKEKTASGIVYRPKSNDLFKTFNIFNLYSKKDLYFLRRKFVKNSDTEKNLIDKWMKNVYQTSDKDIPEVLKQFIPKKGTYNNRYFNFTEYDDMDWFYSGRYGTFQDNKKGKKEEKKNDSVVIYDSKYPNKKFDTSSIGIPLDDKKKLPMEENILRGSIDFFEENQRKIDSMFFKENINEKNEEDEEFNDECDTCMFKKYIMEVDDEENILKTSNFTPEEDIYEEFTFLCEQGGTPMPCDYCIFRTNIEDEMGFIIGEDGEIINEDEIEFLEEDKDSEEEGKLGFLRSIIGIPSKKNIEDYIKRYEKD